MDVTGFYSLNGRVKFLITHTVCTVNSHRNGCICLFVFAFLSAISYLLSNC